MRGIHQPVKTMSLSKRALLAKPSPTLTITAKANAMKAEGMDIIGFGAGEPDFPTPEPVCQAAIRAIEAGFTKYTPTSGIKELKEAIARKLTQENFIETRPEQVVVSCGAKHSLYNASQMLLDPGDEAIIISPHWMTYLEQILMAGATPVVVKTEAANGFIPTPEAVADQITPRTKAIFINSPCNPTGAVIPGQILKEIAQIALKNDVWIISDEIYEKLVYGDAEHVSIASFGKEFAERTVTIGGCSKSYAMTGWRIGYAACAPQIATQMSCFQDSVTSNPNSFAQKGAVEAFNLPPSTIEAMRQDFDKRRELIREEFFKIDGVGVPDPKGAFYFLVDVNNFLHGRIANDVELADHLLQNALVATVPGSVFDAPGFLRLSYTASRENIIRGVARIGEALSELRS
jgi:aspartate aminotransferase